MRSNVENVGRQVQTVSTSLAAITTRVNTTGCQCATLIFRCNKEMYRYAVRIRGTSRRLSSTYIQQTGQVLVDNANSSPSLPLSSCIGLPTTDSCNTSPFSCVSKSWVVTTSRQHHNNTEEPSDRNVEDPRGKHQVDKNY